MTGPAIEAEVRRRLATALKQLSVLDSHLLAADANERAIVHRFAVHLEQHFDGWDVDCEYDLARADPASLADLEATLAGLADDEPLVRDTAGRTIHPDVVVHRRSSGEHLLVIELEKSTRPLPDELARRKLEAYRAGPDGYRFGCHVRVRTGRSVVDRVDVDTGALSHDPFGFELY